MDQVPFNRGIFSTFKRQNERNQRIMKVRIKEVAMERKGFSLYRVAKELKLPQQTVYSWASGRTQPGYDNMDKLVSLFGCRLDDIFVPDRVNLGLL